MKRPMHPRKRLRKIIRESRQFIQDVESWNQNRPDAPPEDCEEMRVILKHALHAAELWDLGLMDAANEATDAMTEYAKSLPE